MGNHYIGCIGYADDITLLTLTRSPLKALIKNMQKNTVYILAVTRVYSCFLEMIIVNPSTELRF